MTASDAKDGGAREDAASQEEGAAEDRAGPSAAPARGGASASDGSRSDERARSETEGAAAEPADMSATAARPARPPSKARARTVAARRAFLQRLARWRLGFREAWRRVKGMDQPRLWLLSLLVGVLSGGAAVLFVLSLKWLHLTLYGAPEETLATAAAAAPAWLLILLPVTGGLIVGLTMRAFCRDAAPFGVADVIEARALRAGRLDVKRGAATMWCAAISLGFGSSGGREGPAVVAGATVASAFSEMLNLRGQAARTILGCSVAAAVSASFNAPIAGALFALEVVLGHYAVRAFAPITIASVAGAVISRTFLGDEPAFVLPDAAFGSYAQFPAFALLGLVSAAVAMAMMWSIFFARDVMNVWRARIGAPVWTQPMLAGAVLGLWAILFPHTVSVGYQTTSEALAADLDFWTCLIFVAAKTVAVAVTLGGRFAGGVFSPALMLGALTGCAFGHVATDIFPSVSGSEGLYALAGMGAVSGAVLGAPISTTLIVFELTGDYGTAIAVMVSTSVATVATQQLLQKSFFHWQLAERGMDLSKGPQTFLLPNLKVRDAMRPRGAENAASDTASWDLVEQGADLGPDDTLAKAFPMFQGGKLAFLPVVDARSEGQGKTLIGQLFYVDALRAYNRALVQVHEEEHS